MAQDIATVRFVQEAASFEVRHLFRISEFNIPYPFLCEREWFVRCGFDRSRLIQFVLQFGDIPCGEISWMMRRPLVDCHDTSVIGSVVGIDPIFVLLFLRLAPQHLYRIVAQMASYNLCAYACAASPC